MTSGVAMGGAIYEISTSNSKRKNEKPRVARNELPYTFSILRYFQVVGESWPGTEKKKPGS